jgi:NAD(P)-dependent dehydrogenase (short-subunit alcohol dehydrogenase family)
MAASTAANALFSVAGKNVVVTGGSRGIGYMMAAGFVQAGAHVLLTSRDEKACAQAASELQCRYLVSNLSSREGCEQFASQISDIFPKLHVLINNAGTSWGEPLDRKSAQNSNWGFDKVLDLNVKGIFYLTRACLPVLQAAASPQDPARIINIGSVAGIIPQAAPTHAYDISKAAVHQLSKKLAADLAPQHITCNALAPGFVPSRMSAGLSTWGGSAEELAARTPLGRLGNAQDMAGAAIFLASPAASFITGIVLPVDGGITGAYAIPMSSL